MRYCLFRPTAIDKGSIASVLLVGIETQVIDVFGIKNDKQFLNTLEDNVIQQGALHKFIIDFAQVIASNKVQEIFQNLCIMRWQSEPYQHHQNAAERRTRLLQVQQIVSLNETLLLPICESNVSSVCVI
jgi:hypothetical protein